MINNNVTPLLALPRAIYLGLLLMTNIPYLIAQERNPYFWLPKKPTIQETDYYKSPIERLKPFWANPDWKQKKHLIATLWISQIDTTDYQFAVFSLLQNATTFQRKNMAEEVIKELKLRQAGQREEAYSFVQKVILDSIPRYSIWEENYFITLDFDHDSNIDMLLVPRVYFGPSLGFAFYAYQQGRFQYLFDNSGEILQVEERNQAITLRYAITQIDSEDAKIIQHISYLLKKECAILDTRVMYADNTLMPTKSNPHSIYFESITDSLYLRTHPEKNDNIALKKASGGYENITLATPKDNIIAQAHKKAQGYILAEIADWYFIVLKLDDKVSRHYLQHGLEPNFSQMPYYSALKDKIFLMGWIAKQQVKTIVR